MSTVDQSDAMESSKERDSDRALATTPSAQSIALYLPITVQIKRHLRGLTGDEGGGSQPQVFEDEQGRTWMVKAPNQRQGGRVLAAEFVAASLGARLSAAVPAAAICVLSTTIAAAVRFADAQPWAAGEGFGSKLLNASTYVPSMQPKINNREGLLMVVALDTWLGRHDSRQARAVRLPTDQYDVFAVDFGHCLGAAAWDAGSLAAASAPTQLDDTQSWSGGVSSALFVKAVTRVSSVTEDELAGIAAAIPALWNVPTGDRKGLVSYLVGRQPTVAGLLADGARTAGGRP